MARQQALLSVVMATYYTNFARTGDPNSMEGNQVLVVMMVLVVMTMAMTTVTRMAMMTKMTILTTMMTFIMTMMLDVHFASLKVLESALNR